MRCEDVSLLLSESAEAGSNLPRSIAKHTERCLRCQAEQAQYRKIRKAMIAMRPMYLDPGTSMVGEVMTLVREDGICLDERSGGDRRRVAYVAAAATAATAATAAGALVLASRGKRTAS
ncbi:MAG: hypothetical protein R2735_15595 [Microthrixaceae bacterium]